MKKLLALLIVFSFLIAGCGQEQERKKDGNDQPEVTGESNQVDDFKVSIHVEDELDAYATITYVGEEAEKEIYHGGSIFYFNIYQLDGDFKHLGAMDQPLLTTTLIQNEPHRVTFNNLDHITLKPGKYKFEAIAQFSLDSDDVLGTEIEIPVSKIVVVE